MELVQGFAIPFIIIVPAIIIYAILLKIVQCKRVILAIISGIFGGILFGQFFALSMHLNSVFISFTYFGMIGACMFYGLAELSRKKRLVNFKGKNIGFLLAALVVQYLIFFDIKGIALSLDLDFMSDYWLVWILNLTFIVAVGLVLRKLLDRFRLAP